MSGHAKCCRIGPNHERKACVRRASGVRAYVSAGDEFRKRLCATAFRRSRKQRGGFFNILASTPRRRGWTSSRGPFVAVIAAIHLATSVPPELGGSRPRPSSLEGPRSLRVVHRPDAVIQSLFPKVRSCAWTGPSPLFFLPTRKLTESIHNAYLVLERRG